MCTGGGVTVEGCGLGGVSGEAESEMREGRDGGIVLGMMVMQS